MLKCRNVLWGLPPLALLSACAHQEEKTWIDITDAAYTTDVPDGRSPVVFHCQADAIEGSTISICVDSQYLGSLQPNAYRQELTCAQNQKLHAGFTRQDAVYQYKVHSGGYYNPPKGTVSLFKVTNDGSGHPILQSVSPEQARVEMKGVKHQNHTLSRVVSKDKCAQVSKKYNLQVLVSFKFNRSGYQDMLGQGKREASTIPQDIKQNPTAVTSTSVVGHTDPEGRPECSDVLFAKRAQTVKQALSSSGLDGNIISTQGKGERELMATSYRKRSPKDTEAYKKRDQPNHRIEVILHGKK